MKLLLFDDNNLSQTLEKTIYQCFSSVFYTFAKTYDLAGPFWQNECLLGVDELLVKLMNNFSLSSDEENNYQDLEIAVLNKFLESQPTNHKNTLYKNISD